MEHARRRAVGPEVRDIIDGSQSRAGEYIRTLSAEQYDGHHKLLTASVALSRKGTNEMRQNTENTNDSPILAPTLFPRRQYLFCLSVRR